LYLDFDNSFTGPSFRLTLSSPNFFSALCDLVSSLRYKACVYNQAATPNTPAITAPTSTGPRETAAAVRVAEADAEALPVRDMEDVPEEPELRETEEDAEEEEALEDLIGVVR
jgi:hypothetical protein